MPSVARAGIFIAYHFPEKRWLDRVVATLQPVVGDTPIEIWDDRKLLGGYAWRGELADTLARSKVAVMIVSDPFLLSGFITRAKLPALLDREREHGLRICWVLAGYCLFSVAGLRAEEAGNGINAALDGLSGAGRDAQIADVARKIAQLLDAPAAGPAPQPAAPVAAPIATSPTDLPTPPAGLTAEPAEPKPRSRRKRSSKNEPLPLLPLLAEAAEPPPPIIPPPPQPHLEFPAPKPQTHLSVADIRAESTPTPEPENIAPVEALPVATSATPPATPAEKPDSAEAARTPAPEPPPPTPKAAAPTLVLSTRAPAPPPPASTDTDPPLRRAESPILPALDAVVEARQESIDTLRRLARWLKLAALAVGVLSLPAALWIGLTHFLLIFGFALFLASLTLFLHARIALLGQRLVGLRYTRSGLTDELLPNRQREPLLRRAAEILR